MIMRAHANAGENDDDVPSIDVPLTEEAVTAQEVNTGSDPEREIVSDIRALVEHEFGELAPDARRKLTLKLVQEKPEVSRVWRILQELKDRAAALLAAGML
jgi:hypothetical protein